MVLQLLSVVKRWNVGHDAVLAGSPYALAELEAPSARVPVSDLVQLVRRARELTGEPALGVYLGLAHRAANWGYLGFATMSAPTMRAALGLGVRFVSTFTTAYSLELRERGPTAEFVLSEHADFGDTRDVFILSTLVAILTVGHSMTGRTLAGKAHIALPRPDYADRIAGALPRLCWGEPENRLVFPATNLDFEYTQHEPVALKVFVEHCERLLDSTAVSGQLTGRIRALLRASSARFPTVEDAASAVGMSLRTLKRKLAAENGSFRDLLDDERHERALPLVRSDLPLSQIASRLGYSNVANFERAFRRWTSCTPTAYRNGLVGGAVAGRATERGR